MLSLSAAFCAALGNQHTHSPPASLIATRTFVKSCSLIDHSVVPSTSSFQPNVAHMVFVDKNAADSDSIKNRFYGHRILRYHYIFQLL